MKNTSILLFLSFFIFSTCSTTNKNAHETLDAKAEFKRDIYTNILNIAESLPLTSKEASDFFAALDSVKLKKFRNSQSQQFQYKTFTVFYEQPGKGKKLRGVGIDLDTTSHVNMEQLGKRLNSKWHSTNLVEVKAGKIHYTADYLDSKKMKKKIHVTIGLSNSKNSKNEIAFIGIDMEQEKRLN